MSDLVTCALWLVIGYLLGSLPSAYLAGKLIKGIDLRDYGSGNVGGANVLTQVSKWAFAPVVLADIAKSLLPTWAALQMTGSGWAAMAAGTGAVIGHCWSLYLSFTGGRGMASAIGTLLLVFPWAVVWVIAIHFIAAAVHLAALGDILALATLPVVALVTGQSAPVVCTGAIVSLVVGAKRLHANRLPLPQEAGARRTVLWRRLLHDRDVPPGEPWTERTHIREER